MSDKLNDLINEAKHEIANLKAEKQALTAQVQALRATKAELQDEIKDWPQKAAEFRKMKADMRAFADSI